MAVGLAIVYRYTAPEATPASFAPSFAPTATTVPSPETDTEDPYDRASSNSLLFMASNIVYGFDTSSREVGATDNNEGDMDMAGEIEELLETEGEGGDVVDEAGPIDARLEVGIRLPNEDDADVDTEEVGPVDTAGIRPGDEDLDNVGPADDEGIPGTDVEVPKMPRLLFVAVGKVSMKLVGPIDAAGI